MLYVCCMKLQTLKTIKNYAAMQQVTTSYIYKLITEKKMLPVVIDGVKFIDFSVYPTIKG